MITQLFIAPTRIGTLSCVSGSVTLTGVNTRFASTDVGKQINVRTSKGYSKRVIASYASATSVNVNTFMEVTESGLYYSTKFEEVDLSDDIPFSLNYSIADIREPEKRNTSYSKSITIPGSKVNNQLFDHIFEIDSDGGYNPNLKAEAIVYSDNIEVFRGVLKLDNIVNVGDVFQYECSLTGRLGDLFFSLGDSFLTDLDLTEYNHDYNKANQQLSWATSIKKSGAVYPFTLGEGYVYPLIDYGFSTDHKTFEVNNLYPSIYAKTYLDKIFQYAGFTYTSTFLNSEFFKRLIIPCNSDSFKLSDSQITSRTFKASSTSITQKKLEAPANEDDSFVIQIDNDTTAPNTDPSNVFNTSTYKWTVSDNGTYQVSASANVRVLYQPYHYSDPSYIAINYELVRQAGTNHTVLDSQLIEFDDYGVSSGDYSAIENATINREVRLYAADQVYTRLTYYSEVGSGDFYQNITSIGVISWTSGSDVLAFSSSGFDDSYLGALIKIESGHVDGWPERVTITEILSSSSVRVDAFATSSGSDSSGGFSSRIYFKGDTYIQVSEGASLSVDIPNANFKEGDTVILNRAIPAQVKQKEFILGLLTMFNLYIDIDKQVENNLIIETRNDFYSGGENKDWTKKLDISQEVEQLPMGELDARRYIFRYKDDNDYLNETYQKAYGNSYGYRKIDIVNDFVKDERIIQPVFSATPSIGYPETNRVIPGIYSVDKDGKIITKVSNVRILYYGGLKDSNPAWIHRSMLTSTPDDTSRTTYPYAGHLDDPYNPTLDLSFGVPKEIYWRSSTNPSTLNIDSIAYTFNNLYNRYYKQFIEEITDKNSKIITGYFYLTQQDIFNLDFRDNIFVNGHYLRLNKIIDYNPNTPSLTKCEFIKIKAGVPYTATTAIVTGGAKVGIGDIAPNYQLVAKKNDNFYNSSNNTVNGSGNYVNNTATNVVINGNDNTVGGNSSNISILGGNNNTIVSGVTNVTLINTSNTTVRRSNVTYMNGVLVTNNNGAYNLIQGGRNELRSITATSQANVIQGGRNELRSVGATSALNKINGGINSI